MRTTSAPMLVALAGTTMTDRATLITRCTRCDGPLELGDEASYVRCPRCGASHLVDTMPPWALADTATGPTLVAKTPAAPAPPGTYAPSRPPPPPRRPPSQVGLATPMAAPPAVSRSLPPAPADVFTEELVAIRCARCGTQFDGPVGMLQCPRCGAHHAVDAAPPWELTTLDESL